MVTWLVKIFSFWALEFSQSGRPKEGFLPTSTVYTYNLVNDVNDLTAPWEVMNEPIDSILDQAENGWGCCCVEVVVESDLTMVVYGCGSKDGPTPNIWTFQY